jgi:hypothetical protein
MEALAAARADAAKPLAGLLARDGGLVSRALELAVVTARLEQRLADLLVQRAATHRGVSLVWVDAATFAGRGPTRENGLLRLQSAGVAVAVVRSGDDLRTALGAPRLERTAHG